jgi:hypothetical protein
MGARKSRRGLVKQPPLQAEPLIAIPEGKGALKLRSVPAGRNKAPGRLLRLQKVESLSGSSYPIVLGEPESSKLRRSS